MKLAALTLISLLSASVAGANDIRWKPEALKTGDYVTIDQTQGGVIHHVFAGKRNGQYVIESYSNSGSGREKVFTTYLDRDGNYLRWVRKDGFELVFRPHDCTRTLGRCQYTQTSSKGEREVRLRITEASRKGFKFDEYGADGKRLFGGTIELDDRGTAGNGRITGRQGTNRYKLIQRAYQ